MLNGPTETAQRVCVCVCLRVCVCWGVRSDGGAVATWRSQVDYQEDEAAYKGHKVNSNKAKLGANQKKQMLQKWDILKN